MEVGIANYASSSLVAHLSWRVTLRSSSCSSFSSNPSKSRSGRLLVANVERTIHPFKANSPTLRRVNCSAYVAEGSEIVRRKEQSGITTIPSLPEEDYSAVITSNYWTWKPNLNVHYEKAGAHNASLPVVFLPGFGVGSFHYEKQLKDLGRDYKVYALDFLGQGFSLPNENPTSLSQEAPANWGFGDSTEPWASDLSFSMDLWRDQVRHFVEEVVGEPVYLVGNSLGGFVSLYFAASYPHLVRGVTLLNATPFWGFFPNPVTSPKLAKIFPSSGTFPLPSSVRKVVNVLWEKISDPRSIAEVLKQVYADHSTDVEKVFSKIVEITQHPAAAASFASIMCSPKGQLSFKESLAGCKESNIPICLVYGREDPWVRPFWGLKAKRQVPEAAYYEISPAGHCPHDEVPEVVNYLIRGWINNVENENALPLREDVEENQNSTLLKELEFIRGSSKKSVKVKLHGNKPTFWNKFGNFLVTGQR